MCKKREKNRQKKEAKNRLTKWASKVKNIKPYLKQLLIR